MDRRVVTAQQHNCDGSEAVASRPLRSSGMTIPELCLGLIVIVLVVSVLLGTLSTTHVSLRGHRDKVFAYSVAQGILAELTAMVEASTAEDPFDATAYDDGTGSSPTLSITREGGKLVAPDHPISGNIQRNGNWIWQRRININRMPGPGSRNLYYVTVKVLKKAPQELVLASLSTVLNHSISSFPSTQVYDVYLLAIDTIPGWWLSIDAARSHVEATLYDLESRNPGLEFRTHWITKASYGRNPVYRPYINATIDTLQNIPEVYFYPGKLPGGGSLTNAYSWDLIKGRLLTDQGEMHGYDAGRNPFPYAVADFYNHAMRLPQEQELHAKRVALARSRQEAIDDALARDLPPPPELDDMSQEPTLRLFLEDLNSNPSKYQNAIVLNLHGEMLPAPPLRNYSDAAKLPRVLPGVRVVAHPEQLRTERPTAFLSGEDVVLRVYAYTTSPATFTGLPTMPMANPILVKVYDLDLTDGAGDLQPGVTIEQLTGGVKIGSGLDLGYKPFQNAKKITDPTLKTNEMAYWTAFVRLGTERFTAIWLWNTPVVAPYLRDRFDASKVRGLEATKRSRLYGLEYVPACTGSDKDFSRDLYTPGPGPKNTARWRIRIPKSMFASARFVNSAGAYYNPRADVTLKIQTRIWDGSVPNPYQGATMYPVTQDPENVSETYTWWADSREDVPFTERSQFLGDPRHNPYKDLYDDDDLDFPNGYNWYHDSLDNGIEDATNDFPGLDEDLLSDGWNGLVRLDLPRFAGLYRRGLTQSHAVYSSVTGWSGFYTGIGNEIGSDADHGYPDSLPMNLRPYGNPGAAGFINNIGPEEGGVSLTGGRRFVRDSGLAPDHWWGLPWLGEHYPDGVYASQWIALDAEGKVRGNLAAGNLAGQFQRSPEDIVHNTSRYAAYGTTLRRSHQRSGTDACTAWFNIGSDSRTFHHRRDDGATGNLAGAGFEIRDTYNVDLAPVAEINKPFALDVDFDGGPGPQFDHDPYAKERYAGRLLSTYYDHPTGYIGSGLMELMDPLGRASAFVVVSGLKQGTTMTSRDLAKHAVLTNLHSFFVVSNKSLPIRIPQLPRVQISDPTEVSKLENPAVVNVTFDVEWTRWDGQKYTPGVPDSFAENEWDLRYVGMYSKDDGRTWLYMDDDSPARIGAGPESPVYLHPDAGSGPETLVWNVPAASFPPGFYLLRIEAYRGNRSLHYAYHQVQVLLKR